MVEVYVEVRIPATLTRVCWMGGLVGLRTGLEFLMKKINA
jgi:hypothetical protein